MLARRICIALTAVLGILAASTTAEDSSTVRASAQASASSDHGVEVSTGTFVIERGARLAVEIVRDDPCVCLCGLIHVEALALLDGTGRRIREESFGDEVALSGWLGRVSLVDGESGDPLPIGAYTVRVVTSVGVFSAQLEVVTPSALAGRARSSVRASICGLELRLSRLITQEDDGASISLRVDDRLLIALEGNATTGYQWENVVYPEYAMLQETHEMEYRQWPHPEGMVGVGGEFLFRYEAVDVGQQTFRFIYHQPWNPDEAAEILEFDVTVY